ncbi:cation/H(+) antiporter 15-like [Vigna radiata var. radiata]|uniref:Cation/H(+) antiporter 15-like n=1 Tax=Vigna radiata var. radiata TaxID=3916 RepID=A0A1S3TBD5_VIGRR|nr:cation/H(+) antiporter 15-like [Vigna radiata var. radiata]
MNSSDYETTDSIIIDSNNTLKVCFDKSIYPGSALWLENSLEETLPSFVLQFAIILALNRFLFVLAEQCHVPRIVANIFTGFLLGTSVMGRWKVFMDQLFPYSNMIPLETVGSLALVYYVFLVGLEIDLNPIKTLNRKTKVIAIASAIFPIPIGFGLYYMLVTDMGRKHLSSDNVRPKGAMLWGIALSCSSEFPEIAKILSDLKLLLTENGQLALTASLLNDLISWTLLVLALSQFYHASVVSFVITVVILLLCFMVLNPLFKWIFNNVGMADKEFLESQVIFVLNVVLVVGLLTDGLGVLSITGAFFLGVVMPQGSLNNAVQDKVQDFVAVLMMPLFFVIVGERIRIQDLALQTHWTTVFVVVLLAMVTKILCTMAVTWFYRMPHMEGFSLALLMNTKGIMPLIILCTGRDRHELDNQTFGVMVLACWLMTIPVGPVSSALTKALKSRMVMGSLRRTHDTQPDSPLKLLACIHAKRDANVIIDLLKASCPSVRNPIQLLAVELNKTTNRPAASLIIRNARNTSFTSRSLKLGSEDTLGSFDNLSQAIFAEKMSIMSDYNTMHQDIINLARHRGVTLILSTFHKQPTYDGLGAGAATARAVNIINRDHASKDEKKVVLESLVKGAPCCLAILVDRGVSRKRSKELRVAMFYVGGADDREALSYAWRMTRSSEVNLMLVRLVWDNPNDEFDETDKEFLKGFMKKMGDSVKVRYLEKVVKDEDKTVKLLNKIAKKGFDLFVVGRGHGRKMSLAQTVDPVLEEPVLGPLGDALTDLNSAAETSILIFQRQGEQVDGKHVRSASSPEGKLFTCMMEQMLMCPSTRSTVILPQST